MHFTTLYILKGEDLDNLDFYEIERDFYDRFCYGCGENRPRYLNWCDWFQIGGRWSDILKAKKGIFGERSLIDKDNDTKEGVYSIVNIEDLTEPLDRKQIYAVATRSKIILSNDNWSYGKVDPEKFNKLLDDIDNKKFKGVIALIDCHD